MAGLHDQLAQVIRLLYYIILDYSTLLYYAGLHEQLAQIIRLLYYIRFDYSTLRLYSTLLYYAGLHEQMAQICMYARVCMHVEIG